MAHLNQIKYSAKEIIAVNRSYLWNNGTKVHVRSIWSDKYSTIIDYIVTEANDEPEMIGRLGETTPNSFYWQTNWHANT